MRSINWGRFSHGRLMERRCEGLTPFTSCRGNHHWQLHKAHVMHHQGLGSQCFHQNEAISLTLTLPRTHTLFYNISDIFGLPKCLCCRLLKHLQRPCGETDRGEQWTMPQVSIGSTRVSDWITCYYITGTYNTNDYIYFIKPFWPFCLLGFSAKPSVQGSQAIWSSAGETVILPLEIILLGQNYIVLPVQRYYRISAASTASIRRYTCH